MEEQRVDVIREVLKTLTGPIDKEFYNNGSGRAIADCDAVAERIDDAIARWEKPSKRSVLTHRVLCPISDFLDKWDGKQRCLCHCHRPTFSR